MLLDQVKLALRVTVTAYDAEIAGLINAAAMDLKHTAGVDTDGVSITVTFSQGAFVVTDASTITDELIIRAIITYVRQHFGSPDDHDRLKQAYDEMKAQLITCTGYGLPEDAQDDEPEDEAQEEE